MSVGVEGGLHDGADRLGIRLVAGSEFMLENNEIEIVEWSIMLRFIMVEF